MRRVVLMICLAVVSNSAIAEFTCEQIKDKATRASCIKDRVEKEKVEVAQQNNEQANFVGISKEALVANYKDPTGAQFTNLVIVNDTEDKSKYLCGWVNGKNSYGGYVGAKMFFVKWSGSGLDQLKINHIWTEGEEVAKTQYEQLDQVKPRNMTWQNFKEAQGHSMKASVFSDLARKIGAMEICEESSERFFAFLKGREAGQFYKEDEEYNISYGIKHGNRKYLRIN